MSARSIAVPAGADIRLCIRPPHHAVVAAPPPLIADIEALLATPNVVGLFTHDPGVDWPDRAGCKWVSAYLASGHAIILQLTSLHDALSAQPRLSAGVVR